MKVKFLKYAAVAILVFVLGVVVWGYFSYTNFLKEEYVTVDGIFYERLGDTSYYVTGCEKEITLLNIPAEINGLPVTAIEDCAFQNNKNIEEVVLPDTITFIPSNSTPFLGCTNIRKITMANDDVIKLFVADVHGDEHNTNPLPPSLRHT